MIGREGLGVGEDPDASVENAAYSYLPASVGTFPPPDAFMATLRDAGFEEVRAVPLSLGIVYLYTAVKR